MFDNLPVTPDRGPYPIHGLGPVDVADLIAFALGLDERALSARFHRHMTPQMVSAHYRALDWDRTVAIAWIADGEIRGVCEALIHSAETGVEAELALCVADSWRGRGIGHLLVARAAAEAARRGATRSLMLLHRDDCANARIVRRLGGTVDWDLQLAILTH